MYFESMSAIVSGAALTFGEKCKFQVDLFYNYEINLLKILVIQFQYRASPISWQEI